MILQFWFGTLVLLNKLNKERIWQLKIIMIHLNKRSLENLKKKAKNVQRQHELRKKKSQITMITSLKRSLRKMVIRLCHQQR